MGIIRTSCGKHFGKSPNIQRLCMTETAKMQPPNTTSQPPGPKPGNPTANMGGSQNRWTARNARVRDGLTKDYEGTFGNVMRYFQDNMFQAWELRV